MKPGSSRGERIAVAALFALLGAAVVFTLTGMALMRFAPAEVARAGPYLPLLMKGPTWVYMLTLPLVVFLVFRPFLGWKRSIAFLIWGSGVGAIAELVGTQTGWPFGAYAYTGFLDPKIAGHVPWLIPPSWYAMSVISLALAAAATRSRTGRIVLGAFWMVLWDVILDPAMGFAFPVWTWAVDGFFYGMPLLNWVGWLITAAVIMWGYDAMGGLREHRTPWTVPIWIASMLLPIGICAVRGFPWVALLGIAAMLIPLAAPVLRSLSTVRLLQRAT